MIQELLVPIDGSAASSRALDVASALGARLGVPVASLTVTSPGTPPGDPVWLSSFLAGRSVARADVRSAPRVADAILDAAAEPGVVVCMASHGRRPVSEVVIGSVSGEILRRSPAPVLLVGPRARPATRFDAVEICLDGSRTAERAVPVAGAWAARLGATPWLFRVANPSDRGTALPDVTEVGDLARMAAMLREDGLDPQWDVLHDQHAAGALAGSARSLGAALVAVTTHGRTGLDRVLLGSVAARLVHLAPCPVLVVGPAVPDGDALPRTDAALAAS